MKYCPNCHTQSDDSSTFCMNCGQPFPDFSQSNGSNSWDPLIDLGDSPTTVDSSFNTRESSDPLNDESDLPTSLLTPPQNNQGFSGSGYTGGGPNYTPPFTPNPTPIINNNTNTGMDDSNHPIFDPSYPATDYRETETSNHQYTSSQSTKKKSKIWIWILIGILLLGGAGFAGYYFFFNTSSETTSSNPPSIVTEIEWTPGIYKASMGMNVRKGPGNSYPTIASSQLKTGEEVEVTEIKKNEDGSIWGKIASSKWVALSNGSNQYLTKIGE